MGRHILGIKLYEFISLTTWVVVLAYFAIGYSLPFSFWIDVKETTYQDICVGDTGQFVMSTRTPLWTIPAHADSQVIEFVNNRRIETDIFREADPIYQAGDYTEYYIDWGHTFERKGIYGATTIVEIEPLPFIKSREVFKAEERLFEVKDCI